MSNDNHREHRECTENTENTENTEKDLRELRAFFENFVVKKISLNYKNEPKLQEIYS